jgi:hypothetical protein
MMRLQLNVVDIKMTIDESELSLVFPKGTLVFDRVVGKRYVVGIDALTPFS